MPRPRKGESRSEFVSRATEYMIKREGLKQKHAVAKAYGIWRESQKKKRKGHVGKKRKG